MKPRKEAGLSALCAEMICASGALSTRVNGKGMPYEWQTSVLVPIFEGKGDVRNCNTFRGVKLSGHAMKIVEKMLERIRELVNIDSMQFDFFCFSCHIYPPFTRKRIVSLYFGREVRTRLGVAFFEVYGPPVFHIKVGRPVKCLAQGHNKRTCRLVLHNLP